MSRLLLVEDDPELGLLLQRYLSRSGFEIVLATDGAAGVQAFESADFDAIVTDGLLPKKLGLELVEEIRASSRGREIPIVLVSAAFKATTDVDPRLELVDAFFHKPFVLSELKQTLIGLTARRAPAAANAAVPVVPSAVATQAPGAPAGGVAPTRVAQVVDVARLLLHTARSRLSGLLRFTDGHSRLELAFLRGVLVGATDNLREHLLGDWLWNEGRLTAEQMLQVNQRIAERGERVAETCLALGMCTAHEALEWMDGQARVRARRSLAWTGHVERVEGERHAQALAVTSLDLPELILGFAVEPGQEAEAQRFVEQHAASPIRRGPCFDDLLLAFVEVLPGSSLPCVLFSEPPTLADVARASSPSEVWAGWLVGLFSLAHEPPLDETPLPDLLKRDDDALFVDKELAGRVSALLLKARGRTHYELLGVPKGASSEDVLKKVAELTAVVGPDALAGKALGPATVGARELWGLLEDARRTFSDPSLRQLYDARPLDAGHPQGHSTIDLKASVEEQFWRGRLALDAGDHATALACFQAVLSSRSDDPDFQSYLGWTEVLCGDVDAGLVRLEQARQAHPQALRPLVHLALAAARGGDAVRAHVLLAECQRRSPHDLEVKRALSG